MKVSGGQIGILVAALFIGAAAGYVGGMAGAGWRIARHYGIPPGEVFGRHGTDQDRPLVREAVIRRLDAAVHLRPEQKAQVRDIMERGHRRLMEQSRIVHRGMTAVRDSIQTEIEQVLDEPQRVKYRQLIEDMHRRWGRGGRGEEPEDAPVPGPGR